MKQKLLLDISNIFSIRISILNKLVELAEACICDYLVEASLGNEDLVEINIGIGKILILILEDSIEYQFIPSLRLEKLISKSMTSGISLLETNSESGIEEKLLSTYKELF